MEIFMLKRQHAIGIVLAAGLAACGESSTLQVVDGSGRSPGSQAGGSARAALVHAPSRAKKHSGTERGIDSFTVAGAAPGSWRLCGSNTPSPASLFHPVGQWPQST